MLSSVEHKRRYFEECGQPNSFWSSVTSIVESLGTRNCLVWLPTFFKVSSFMFNRRKHFRFGTTCGFVNDFWVNYPFKSEQLITFPFSPSSGEPCVQRADVSSRCVKPRRFSACYDLETPSLWKQRRQNAIKRKILMFI